MAKLYIIGTITVKEDIYNFQLLTSPEGSKR